MFASYRSERIIFNFFRSVFNIFNIFNKLNKSAPTDAKKSCILVYVFKHLYIFFKSDLLKFLSDAYLFHDHQFILNIFIKRLNDMCMRLRNMFDAGNCWGVYTH